jgi:hypothetical protein
MLAANGGAYLCQLIVSRCLLGLNWSSTGPPLVLHWCSTGPPLVLHWSSTGPPLATTRYPDIIAEMPGVMAEGVKSFIIDSEAGDDQMCVCVCACAESCEP